MLLLGSHVGMSGKEMFLGSVKEALSYSANTFMVYTGAPQNTRRKELSELRIPEAQALMREKGIEQFIVHAPYIINLGNAVNPSTYELAVYTAGRDTIVALVETLHYPMADSRVEWYDSRWRPLQPLLGEPDLQAWLTRAGRRHRGEVEEAIPFMTAEAVTDPDAGTLTLTRTIDGYFLPADTPDALRWLEPRLVYALHGSRFVRR